MALYRMVHGLGISSCMVFWIYSSGTSTESHGVCPYIGFKIRNSNIEYRNPKQIIKLKNLKSKTFYILNFDHLKLFRASNFEIRI